MGSKKKPLAVYRKGVTRLSPVVKRHVLHMLSVYHDIKRVTRIQSMDYAEDTERYNLAIKWYQIIRETLEEWHRTCPENAAIIEEVYAIGNHRIPISVQRAAMEHCYAVSSVYRLREEFAYDVGMKAIRDKLILTD